MVVAYYAVVAFGVFICGASAIGVLFPRWLVDSVRSAWQLKPAMFLAVLVRLILGTLLICYAPHTKFTAAFRMIGALGLTAAVALPLIGWRRIDNLLAWMQNRPSWVLRAWLLLGIMVGAFLIYGAV